nr:MarR family winged helix-turn-helix transcriptional regulator [Micromonospora sp. DSM 115978]
MTTRSGNHGAGDRNAPLATLLAQARDITVEVLHRQLGDEGFEGIRYRHGSVFRFIDPEGSRLTVLSARSGLTKQAIGEVVDELERLGYVERMADPNDRRAKIIMLTERGAEARSAAARILEGVERDWARHLGQEPIDRLRRTLEAIMALGGV